MPAWQARSRTTPPPYLAALPDPLDADGYVRVPQEPGMGYEIVWDGTAEHRTAE